MKPQLTQQFLDRARKLSWSEYDWAEALASREHAISELTAALADCRRNKRKLLDRVKREETP